MTKEIDVSKIDVGWRVQLNAASWAQKDKFNGKWATVLSFNGSGVMDLTCDGEQITITRDRRNFLAALPPEPAKDPFAPGGWVVCVERPRHCIAPAQVGDILKVSKYHWTTPETWFGVDSFGYEKSNFRPATPEEIAAHLGKDKPSAPAPDGKITFTVAGREFFVGQRVWANTKGAAGLGKLIDVPHEVTGCVAMAELVCIREMDGFNQRVIASSCLSEAPLHEWQFGDQASHPGYGKVLVIDMTEPDSFQCSSPSDPEIFIDPSELTFIRRTDLGD